MANNSTMSLSVCKLVCGLAWLATWQNPLKWQNPQKWCKPPTNPIQNTLQTPYKSAGMYVRFQPRSAGFQEEVGDGVEQVLQGSMFTHSTLTQGEWVQVSYAGTFHDLKVLALKPEPAVSIIGEHQTHMTCHPCTSC